MRIVTFAFLFFAATAAQAQYKCTISGRAVVQDEPCESAASGKYRCFVDGEVIHSAAPCSTIKSKAVLEKEAQDAKKSAQLKSMSAAKILEDADRKNFSRRIVQAEAAAAKLLRDPDSARFSSSRVSWYSGYPIVCGVVSGRNGFGGYANPVRFFAIDDYAIIDDGGRFSVFDDQWSAKCGPVGL